VRVTIVFCINYINYIVWSLCCRSLCCLKIRRNLTRVFRVFIARSPSIRYSGYLYKRSNKPYTSEERITLEAENLSFDENHLIEYNTNNNEDVLSREISQHEQQPVAWMTSGSQANGPPSLPSRSFPEIPDLQEPETKPNEASNGIQNAIELMASFFGHHNRGMKKRTHVKSVENFKSNDSDLASRWVEHQTGSQSATASYGQTSKPTAPKSAGPTKAVTILQPPMTQPIAIVGTSSDSCRSQGGTKKNPIHHDYNDTSAALNVGTKNNFDRQEPPAQNFIDSHDGHIWRAKYCVLVEGVLYFYKNAEIGNSREAELERGRMSTNSQNFQSDDMNEIDHLGKSPMPRNLHPMLTSKEKNGGGSFCHDPNVYWEKRVALKMVGAVRSSPNFGEKAFELIAMSSGEDSDGDDDVDRLVLKASAVNEVQDWIFEIHKSFVVLMKELAAAVGSHDERQIDEFGPASLHAPPKVMNRFRSTSGAIRPNLLSPKSQIVSPAIELNNSPESELTRRRSFGNDATLQNLLISSSMNSTRERANSDDLMSVIGFPLSKIPSSRSSIRLNTDLQHQPSPSNAQRYTIDDKETSKIQEKEKSPNEGKYIPPHLRKQNSSQKYVPPHMRKNLQVKTINSLKDEAEDSYADEVRQQIKSENNEFESLQVASRIPIISENDNDESSEDDNDGDSNDSSSSDETNESSDNQVKKLGGCADPRLEPHSICHDKFKERVDSRVTSDCQVYGCNGDTSEIGAVSRCGIRDYNEDAYLILTDLFQTSPSDDFEPFKPSESYFSRFRQHGLFAIFDGHCGNQAARFAAEKFHCILLEESILLQESLEFELPTDHPQYKADLHEILRKILLEAVTKLDHEFCVFSTEDGRDWYAGSTAIIVLVLDEHVAVAGVGDAGGVFSSATNHVDRAIMKGWSVLEQHDFDLNKLGGSRRGVIYKEVSESHCPSSPEERERIQAANGWITHETEIPIITQFHRMDWGDRDVLDIFHRCFSDRLDTAKPARILDIYRVCGDLAVSRAIGDREYKAAFNRHPDHENEWICPAPMPFNTYTDIHNEDHSGLFEGDLVISTPGIRFFELGSLGTDEFILIACDGLWDVIDPDDAVRVTRKLLFQVCLSTKESADRLAQLAKGLGSSDNITVIVVKFYDR